jgi:hypothetical protein|tara:strand:+ start:1662 stop:2279 length:618 start_codon:yes stop_codon:yes gene_type:complete
MDSLVEILSKYNFNTDKGNPHTYIEYYDKMFSDCREEQINLLEIGVFHGESMKLWSKYFPNVNLYGIDIFTRIEGNVRLDINYVNENLKGYDVQLDVVDSCSESSDRKKVRDEYLSQFEDGFFDIIIDDGQHNSESQTLTYNNFKSKVSKGGLYIIEDIKPWLDGGTRSERTHLEHLQRDIKNLEIVHEGYEDDILGVIRGEKIK